MHKSAPVRQQSPDEPEEQHKLTAVEGLAALSLDALSSVAYGPQAIIIVLATAGFAALQHYTLPVTLAIVLLLAVLVVSYRQVIEAFPSGGGAYAVAKAHLGVQPSLVAAASLVVDYVLNAAVGVSAGVEALTSAFQGLYPDRVWRTGGSAVATRPAQPARVRPRARNPARHDKRGHLPAALPAGRDFAGIRLIAVAHARLGQQPARASGVGLELPP